MRKKIYIISLSLLFSCVQDKSVSDNENINLDDYSNRIGYALGSLAAGELSQLGENRNKLNKELLIDGFNSNLSNKDCRDCDSVMMALVGPYGQDFDLTKIDAGSTCLGRMIANSFYQICRGAEDEISMEMLKFAFKQGVYKSDTLIDQAEKMKMVQDFFGKKIEQEYGLNKTKSKEFLDENLKKDGVKVTSSGLQYEIIKEGSGDKPSLTSTVTVHYHGTLIDGTVFDSSIDRGEPAIFAVNQVIKGWTEALQLMSKGSKYRLYIPQELAYGASPHPNSPIEPYMALIFDVEILEIK